MPFDKGIRRVSGVVLITMLAATLAACGGGGSTPTPTAVPVSTATTVAQTAPTSTTGPVSASGSPIATPVRGASPVAAGATGASTVTREQFQKELLAAYPMEAAASKGGTVVLTESTDISTVNPMLSSDTTSNEIIGTIYEGLLGISAIDGTPVPSLADSWDVGADGLTYTFHLNQAAKWQDGVDLTADDVKFSFDAALNPNSGFPYSTLVNAAIASYQVIDADTFQVVARDKFVSFLYDGPGAVYVMPKHIWENTDVSTWSFDGGSTGEDPSRVIGTGPFKFKEWTQGDHVSVVRNDSYYDVVPTIDQLTLAVKPDTDSSVVSLESGESDIMEIIPAAQTQQVADTPGLKVNIYEINALTFYAMNLDASKSTYFQSTEVRQALFFAIDRDSITANIFMGYGESAVGTQPPLSPGYAPDRMTPSYALDIEKAKALLAQAGWTDTNNNGTVDKDGKEFKFDFLYSGGDATTDQVIPFLKESWKQIGVDMNPVSIEGGTFTDRLKSHDFDMAWLGFSLSIDGDQGLLFSCSAVLNAFNFMSYCNQDYDKLQEAQKREFDPATRAEDLIQQSQIIWNDQPIGPIRFGVARTGYSTRLHNFYPNGFGFLWSLPYMWVAPPA